MYVNICAFTMTDFEEVDENTLDAKVRISTEKTATGKYRTVETLEFGSGELFPGPFPEELRVSQARNSFFIKDKKIMYRTRHYLNL